MRHGPYCRTRSFPAKCKRCGASVLYWECSHGCKFFMEYPIYGRPIRHHCQEKISKKKNQVLLGFKEHQLELAQHVTFQCPVCGRIFSHESDLATHIHKLSKQDDQHDVFYTKLIENIQIDDDESSNLEPISNPLKDPLTDMSQFQTNMHEKKPDSSPDIELKNRSFRIKSKQKEAFENLLSGKKQ